MDHDKKIEEVNTIIDDLIDYYSMTGSIEHKDVVSAIDGFHNEMNRRALLERKEGCKSSKG